MHDQVREGGLQRLSAKSTTADRWPEPRSFRTGDGCRKNSAAPTLRQSHVPGEKLFVDLASQNVSIHSSVDGSTVSASLFVAAFGASGKIFAWAYPDQKPFSWIRAHVDVLEFCDGFPSLMVPDNTWTPVTKACRYEPILLRTYQELADFCVTAILPTRHARPRYKARVESAVQVVQRNTGDFPVSGVGA